MRARESGTELQRWGHGTEVQRLFSGMAANRCLVGCVSPCRRGGACGEAFDLPTTPRAFGRLSPKEGTMDRVLPSRISTSATGELVLDESGGAYISPGEWDPDCFDPGEVEWVVWVRHDGAYDDGVQAEIERVASAVHGDLLAILARTTDVIAEAISAEDLSDERVRNAATGIGRADLVRMIKLDCRSRAEKRSHEIMLWAEDYAEETGHRNVVVVLDAGLNAVRAYLDG